MDIKQIHPFKPIAITLTSEEEVSTFEELIHQVDMTSAPAPVREMVVNLKEVFAVIGRRYVGAPVSVTPEK
jgi:hypothetical protein